MKSEVRIIEEFFQEMKEQDMELEIPLSPRPQHPKKYNWLPLSVAASVLLFLVSYFIYSVESFEEKYAITIRFENNEGSKTESLVNNKASIDMWESPTQSLIEDF